MSDLGTITGATGLESAINAIWAANQALNAAVPVDRLIIGRVPPSEQMPYVRLEPENGTNITRTNLSLYQTERVHFHIWTDGFDAGRAIAPLIRAAFASMAFSWGTGASSTCDWDGPPVSRQVTGPEIKAWHTTVTFTASTWQQRQD